MHKGMQKDKDAHATAEAYILKDGLYVHLLIYGLGS